MPKVSLTNTAGELLALLLGLRLLIQVSYYAANIGGMLLGQVVQWPCLFRSPWVLLSHAIGLPRHLRTRRSMMYQMPTPPEIDDLSSAPAYFVTSDSDPHRTMWYHDQDPKNLRTRGTCHYRIRTTLTPPN